MSARRNGEKYVKVPRATLLELLQRVEKIERELRTERGETGGDK